MEALKDGPVVLACGAWLKNAACLLQVDGSVIWSDNHGDLGDPASCVALEQSVERLLDACDRRVDAIAHDLHPDFFSSQLACRIADVLGVPALPVQHHHAHIAAVMAEHRIETSMLGLALDGVGLGSDGLAWGGELLIVDPAHWQRVAHLRALPLPGGDAAAREPWRMAVSVMQEAGHGERIVARFSPFVGSQAASTVQAMLARGLNCPRTTSAGRWFDAAAGALGLSVRQSFEAEAAIALEKAATQWLDANDAPDTHKWWSYRAGVIDLLPVLEHLLACDSTDADAVGEAAALFHLVLADALADTANHAARSTGIDKIALGGGCFFNKLLTSRIEQSLSSAGLTVHRPLAHSCGDAGLALGQAWVARHALHRRLVHERSSACA